MVSHRAPGPATFADIERLPEKPALEIVDGVVVEKAAPSTEHSRAQGGLLAFLWQRFNRGGGGSGKPGGWWILPECDVELEPHQLLRPDVCGWRREHASELPKGRPVRIRPDWVCEILSASNARTDLVAKFNVFQRHEVPHYWIVDPERELLTVYRWSREGYVVALTAARGDTVRAEPFGAVELPVGILFGEDEPLESDEPSS